LFIKKNYNVTLRFNVCNKTIIKIIFCKKNGGTINIQNRQMMTVFDGTKAFNTLNFRGTSMQHTTRISLLELHKRHYNLCNTNGAHPNGTINGITDKSGTNLSSRFTCKTHFIPQQ
jgi:hypothetical protein